MKMNILDKVGNTTIQSSTLTPIQMEINIIHDLKIEIAK